MRALFFSLCLLLTAGILAQTTPTTGTLQGHITDATTGEPLPDVNVILMKEGRIMAAQGTSANGNYLYDKMYPNTYDVVFAVKGRQLTNREVKGVAIEAGMITTLEVAIGATEIIAAPIDMRPDPKTNPLALAIVVPVDKKTDEVKETFKGQFYPFTPEKDFVLTREQANSTFSSDVDDAFYTIIRRMIQHGIEPPQGAVRIEEMLNYFDYAYPAPEQGDFSVYTESGRCPWNEDHLLLHIGLCARTILQDDLPPAHLVFLIDVSGSMATSDKLPLALSGMRSLVAQLRPKDRVSIVTYSDAAVVVTENIAGSDKPALMRALARLEAGGSTAGGAGLQQAYSIAKKYYIKEGNNRIILCTDGDFNVGPSSDEELLSLIGGYRKSGVYLSALGFGMDNLQDGRLESLATKGNGNYGYIGVIDDAKKLLVREMGGTLQTVADETKLQVRFNPSAVEAYRLIGYENNALTEKEFDKRKTPAGEVGAGQTVTALYEIIPAKEQLVQDAAAAQLEIRYKSDGRNRQVIHDIALNQQDYHACTDDFRFSAAVAAFGLLLRQSAFRGQTDIDLVQTLAASAIGSDKNGYRKDFQKMLEQYTLLMRRK